MSIDIISPDGFSINPWVKFSSESDAWKHFDEWIKRYEAQGYYSSVDYGRIPLDELKQYCTLITYNYE